MEFFCTIHFKLGQHKEFHTQSQMTRHYTTRSEIVSSRLEEPVGVGVRVGNVCAEGRWFGTEVGEVWLFYCLNSTYSFCPLFLTVIAFSL